MNELPLDLHKIFMDSKNKYVEECTECGGNVDMMVRRGSGICCNRCEATKKSREAGEAK